jgi:peptide/nickel transport system substrate-binding protein
MPRRSRRGAGVPRLLLALALCVGASGIAAREGAATGPAASVAPNGVLRIAASLAPTAAGALHLDPAKSTTPLVDYPYQLLVYDALLRRTAAGGFEPSLATKATIADQQTIDVELRAGVTFPDGTPFDAEAVKLGVERNQANMGQQFQAEFAQLAGIDVVGALSLRLRLSTPIAGAFYPLLAGQEFFIVSPTAVRNGVDLDKTPVGAGPFVLKELVPEQKMVFVKNRRYYGAKQIRLAGIEFIDSPAGAPRVSLLKSGGADYGEISVDDIAAMRSADFTVRTRGNDDAMYWLPVCKTNKPLDDPRVRQALNYAIDRDELNQALFMGAGEPQWALWPKANRLFPKDLDGYYRYNPKKARELLKAAGFGEGFEVSVIAPPNAPTVDRMAEVVQAQWQKIGVTLKIVPTANYVQDLYVDHRADFGLNPSIRPGLVHLTGPFTPGSIGNLCGYSNPQLNAIADTLKGLAPDDPQVLTLWKQAQDFVVKDQALGIFGLFGPVVTAWDRKVGGVEVIAGVINYVNYWKVYVKKS